LIGAFVLINVIAVLAVVMLTGSDGDDDSKTDSSASQPPAPRSGPVVVNRAIGARIRKPKGWQATRPGRSINLRSPDGTTLMSVSQPPGGTRSSDVLRTAVAAIRQQYRRVSARPLGGRGRISGLPTRSVVVSATNKKGTRLTILVSAPQGRARAWLVQVFSGPGARAKRLPEAQVSLGTLLLRG
jgi:hypothetical protein